ncbi:MAG: SDR family NAD(P)-dependent oxidoreductase [Pseudomonadota bacterium]
MTISTHTNYINFNHLWRYQDIQDLSEQNILITGAAKGIGRALSLACAGRGARCFLLDQDTQGLDQLYDAILERGHPQPVLIPMDLKMYRHDSMQLIADAIQAEYGFLNGLIHCAAQFHALTPLHYFQLERFQDVIAVNLIAPFLLTQTLLPLIKHASHAHIIFTTCEIAQKGKAFWGPFAAAKSGIERIMESLAEELDHCPQICVNAIDPGPTRTLLRQAAFPAEDKLLHPEPHEVLGPYLYLLQTSDFELSGKIIRRSHADAPSDI